MKKHSHDKAYWRSLDQLADNAEYRRFAQEEFPGLYEHLGTVSRRRFLQFAGASLALAGLAGCRWPEEKIVPFSERPDGWIPGQTKQFATAMELAGSSIGLLVTSFDGRPIKVEGNPLHPISQGATNVYAQASILDLYDPDRSGKIMRREGGQELNQTWDDFQKFAREHFGKFKENCGQGLYFVSELTSSLTVQRLQGAIQEAYPNASFIAYEPSANHAEYSGTAKAFGQPLLTQYSLDQAEVVACLDCDLLHDHPAALKHARDFADRRTGEGGTTRLYAAESMLSLTGAAADHRLAVKSSLISSLLLQLAFELFTRRDVSLPAGAVGIKDGLKHQSHLNKQQHDFISTLADDLVAHPGQSAIAVGPRQWWPAHALAQVINDALGNTNTITYTDARQMWPADPANSLKLLVADQHDGKVNTLVLLGGNPAVYTAPASNLSTILEEIPTTIHLSEYENETSQLCTWHLPRAHYLESWGDCRSWDGTVSIIQPLIRPLHGGKTAAELLSMIFDDSPRTGYELTRETIRTYVGDSEFETTWQQTIHDGILPGHSQPKIPATFDADGVSEAIQRLTNYAREGHDGLELVLQQDYSLYDGRFANNSWLQELPDPITKLTWDNAALLSPTTAAVHQVKHGDIISITVNEQTAEAPVYVQPGQADGSITLALGYGRTSCGEVGKKVGVNTYPLIRNVQMGFADGVTFTKTGRRHKLATTQNHQAIDEIGLSGQQSRIHALVREATVAQYAQGNYSATESDHHPALVSLWDEHEYAGHQWAMAIDLSRCIGCNACVIACQAENNIPVVGKDEVIEGREMHWIRIDRYFAGNRDQPKTLFQPVTCHHCELAPCEQVCPVAATVHDDEGLNLMVYNRCVGTRYCSNNCPYKVRRFNYFNNQKDLPEIKKMMYNPDVTVRGRGVMEKCTFCIQRINAVKISAKNERRPITDGEIVPACAQSCPTKAIVFGDLADPDSRVRKLHEHRRAYGMLEELNVKPRTRYLAKLRNPNDALTGESEHGEHGDG